MSATEEKMDFQNKLIVAASFDSDKIYSSLFALLGYRKRIAEQMLRSNTFKMTENYEELYEYTNNQIKLLLGI